VFYFVEKKVFMSVKNNAFVRNAAIAAGVVMTVGYAPIIESLLDNMQVKAIDAAEIDNGSGRVVVFATVDVSGVDVIRPVADTSGNVRLFIDGSAVVALAKKSQLVPGAVVRFTRYNKPGSVGDPIASLKAKYKKAKVESVAAAVKLLASTSKKAAAVALGWDTSIGSPENIEYLDIVDGFTALTEWSTVSNALTTSLGAALTTAGIDPLTIA